MKNQIHTAPVLKEIVTAFCMHLLFEDLRARLKCSFFPMITNARG
jgi:hypothetical protein